MDSQWVTGAGFYSSKPQSQEILLRSGNKIISKSNKKSFDNFHSKMREAHKKGNRSLNFIPLGKLHDVKSLYEDFQSCVKFDERIIEPRKPMTTRARQNIPNFDEMQKTFDPETLNRVKSLILQKNNPRNRKLKKDI